MRHNGGTVRSFKRESMNPSTLFKYALETGFLSGFISGLTVSFIVVFVLCFLGVIKV